MRRPIPSAAAPRTAALWLALAALPSFAPTATAQTEAIETVLPAQLHGADGASTAPMRVALTCPGPTTAAPSNPAPSLTIDLPVRDPARFHTDPLAPIPLRLEPARGQPRIRATPDALSIERAPDGVRLRYAIALTPALAADFRTAETLWISIGAPSEQRSPGPAIALPLGPAVAALDRLADPATGLCRETPPNRSAHGARAEDAAAEPTDWRAALLGQWITITVSVPQGGVYDPIRNPGGRQRLDIQSLRRVACPIRMTEAGEGRCGPPTPDGRKARRGTRRATWTLTGDWLCLLRRSDLRTIAPSPQCYRLRRRPGSDAVDLLDRRGRTVFADILAAPAVQSPKPATRAE